MRPGEQEESDRPRQRHGRTRRWLVRPFFWGLAAVALLFFVTIAYLESEHFRKQGRRLTVDWLEKRLQREVSAGDIRLELFPLMVEVREVEIAGEIPESPLFARAERVVVEATVGSFLWPGIVLDRILVERPEITVGFDQEGRHDAPHWNRRRPRSEPGSPFDFEIERLDIVDGTLALGHEKYPLDLSARDVRAEMAGGQGIELRGRVTASEVEVQLPRARPYVGRVDIDASFQMGRVDVRQARIDGPDLVATLSGIWQWREKRDVDLRVIADSRLEMFDRLGYLRDFGTGSVHFEGNLRRRPGEWFLDGGFSAPTVAVLNRRFNAVAGQVTGDDDSLRLDIESSSYGGGAVTGAVLISLANDGSRPVTVDLSLSEIDLVRLLKDQEIPVEGLAARVSGPIEYRFNSAQPRGGDGSADLEIRGSGEGANAGLRVSGAAPLVIEEGVIRSEAIRLTSDSQVFLAKGLYDLSSSAGEFEYSIATRKVEELFPLLSSLSEEPDLWRPHSGAGSLKGSFVIAGGATTSDVRIDLEGVEAPGYSASRLLGGLRVERDGVEDLRLELSRPSAAMIVTGQVPFDDISSTRSLQIAVESVGWPLENVVAWLPWDLGLTGGLTGGLVLDGSLEHPRGTLEGRLEPARWRGLDARAMEVALEFDPERVNVKRAWISLDAGVIEGEGVVGAADGQVRLQVSSSPLNLSLLPGIGELAGDLGGDLEVSALLEGSLDDPSLNGVITCHNISVGDRVGEESDSSQVSFQWEGGHLEIAGSLGQLLDVRGGGRLDSEGADLTLAVESGRLGDVLAVLAGSLASGMDGQARGSLQLEAAWGEESQFDAVLRLDRLGVERGQQRLENLETVVLAVDGDGVLVRSLYLGEDETGSEAFVAGRIGKGGRSFVDLNLQASLASEWFSPWLPSVDIRGGAFEVIGTVSGPADDLSLNGQGELRGARALISGFPSSLEEIRGMVLFYPERIVLDDGMAEMAGGRVRAGGSVDFAPGNEASYSFQVSGESLSFRYPEGWLIRGDTELTVASTASGRQVSGVARLDNALYVQDVQLIKSLFERHRVEEGDLEPWRSETQLNLVVETTDGLRIRNNLADLTGGAELGLRGSLARPVLFGTVDLQEGGRLIYSGQEYTVERGSLNFTNPFRIEPVLDLVATTRMREYDVTLSLSGTPERLQTEFVSNPPLAELEVLALLTGGRDPESRAPDRSAAGADGGAAESFLYGQATSVIAGRFNRLFGLDQFRIDPLTSSSGALSSARFTVGKQLSRDLFVTYSYDPSQTEEQILELEWSISRSLRLVLTQNGDGTYAVDARWEKAL